nr:hypothetical protein [uncultured Sphingorhabdus sp.]
MNRSPVLESLRSQIASIEGVCPKAGSIAFGISPIDQALPAGGIANGALHEVAGSIALADDAAATIFLAGILAQTEGSIIWCLRWRELFAPALYLAGVHPDRVIFVEAGSDAGVLAAMEEALRHSGLGGVVGELKKLGATPSKRSSCRTGRPTGTGGSAASRRLTSPWSWPCPNAGDEWLRRWIMPPA